MQRMAGYVWGRWQVEIEASIEMVETAIGRAVNLEVGGGVRTLVMTNWGISIRKRITIQKVINISFVKLTEWET